MPGLLTLAVAKQQLRITDDLHDADVQQKADAASASILEYLDTEADDTWTPDTVPPVVQQCMLILLTFLYEPAGRGDALPAEADPLKRPAPWATIDALLVQRRQSAIA
jgi:hypothetical protein